MRIVAVALLVLCGACPSTEAQRPTDEVLRYAFIETPGGEHPCGPIAGFTGPLTTVCETLEYQGDLEVGCAEAYVKWLSLDTDNPRCGTLQIVSDVCDTTYTVEGSLL